MDFKYFMNGKIKQANHYGGAEATIRSMLGEYDVLGDVAVLPDFTESNSLPVGTTAVIEGNRAINPDLIGMDIGCGYQFFSVGMNPKRFVRKGKLRKESTQIVVDELDRGIRPNIRGRANGNGRIGRGNHFLDLFVVDEIYDPNLAHRVGLDGKKVYFLVHSGSGEKGYDVKSRFAEGFGKLSEGGDERFNMGYLQAFKEAKKHARENRNQLRQCVERTLCDMHGRRLESDLIFDRLHNDIGVENNGNGLRYKLMKGTTQLYPGNIFIIPGNPVSPAYVVVGENGLEASHYSINHGAGRKYTRSQMASKFRRADLSKVFDGVVLNVDAKKMVEEVPKAYKKIEDIMDSVEDAGLARRIAKLRPVGVVVERENGR